MRSTHTDHLDGVSSLAIASDLNISDESQLVIADAGIRDIDVLLGNVASKTEVWRIAELDNVASMLDAVLAGGYKRLHFLGHGNSGSISLGGTELSLEDFTSCALSVNGDTVNFPSLHFWSCLTGSGAKGRAFVDRIANAFGVVVTAFSGLVGAKNLGGSWVPDIYSGVQSFAGFPFINALAYEHTLQTNNLELVAVNTATGVDVQIWLKAGVQVDSVDLWLTYNSVAASYQSASPNASLTGWVFVPNGTTPGVIGITGYSGSFTPITSPTDILLQTISLTLLPGQSSLSVQFDGTQTYLANGSTGVDPVVGPLTPLIVTTVAPVISMFSPADGSKGVTVDSDIVCTFNETVIQGTGLIELRSGSATGPVVESFDVATDTTHLTISGSTLTINPTANLVNNTSYFVTFASGTLKNLQGYNFVGTTAYDFTTVLTTSVAEVHLSNDTGAGATDFITNAALQTISGTLSTTTVAGEVVKISLDNGTTWVAATNSTGQTAFSLGVTLSGSNTLLVRVEDATGNVGAQLSQTYVLDTVAPTITISGLALSADTGTSSTDFITNTVIQTISGTLSAALGAGETLYGTIDNGTTWVDISNKVNGTAISWDGVTLSGSNTIKLEVRDAAGNAGTAVNHSYVLDATAPAAPSLVLKTDSGQSPTDGLTNVGTVMVSGVEANATWEYSTDGGTTWSAGTGSSFTLTAGVHNANSVQARQTDVAGNLSSIAQIATAITVDATAAAPILALTTDSGQSTTDGITNVSTVTVSGVEANATWEYSTDSGTTWSAGTGSSFTLSAGTHNANSVQVRQTDVAGNLSSVGQIATAITVDATAPVAPSLVLATDSGQSTTDGITNVGTVTVSGVEANATWEYSTDGGTTWSVGAGSSFTLLAGTHNANSVQVRQTDVAGNLSSVGQIATSITVDATAPVAPSLALTTDSGQSPTDGITNVGMVSVSGVEANATWEYSTDGGTTWIAGTGSSVTLSAGVHNAGSVQVRQTDVAGNLSSVGQIATAITVDATSPVAPSLVLATDSGQSTTDGITNVGTVTVSGVEANATWEYSTDGGTTWSVGAGSSFTLLAGTHNANSVQVRQTDVAGNLSSVGQIATSITVDATAPVAPSLALTTDSGQSMTDGITNVGTVTVSGVEANATWEYSTDSGTTWSAGTGSSFTLSAGVHNAGSVQVRQTDVAGNLSSVGQIATSITVDATAPVAPSLALTTDSGQSTTDGITNVGTVTVSGVEANATWESSTDSGTTWSAGTGSSFTLSAGVHNAGSVQVRQTDVAGNLSSVGQIVPVITVDATAVTPTLALMIDSGSSGSDGITNISTVTVSGVEANATWEYSTDGGTTWSTGTGSSFMLSAGTHNGGSLQVRQTDVAGNLSNVGQIATAITVDATVPVAPSLVLTTDSGQSATDGITNVGTVTVSGVESNATWEYSTDSGSTWIAGTGSSFTLSAGVHITGSVQVRQTDVAGNLSSAGQLATVVIIDEVPPIVTISGLSLSADTGSSSTDFITDVAAQTIRGTLSTALAVDEKLYGSLDNGATWFDITGKVNGTSLAWDGVTLSGSNTLKLEVHDQAGNAGSAVSQLYSIVVAGNNAPTGSVNITGTAIVGQVLTASNTLADADGLGTINYQWQSNGVDITGATTDTYTLTSVDVGSAITVAASYVDGKGKLERVGSVGTSPVIDSQNGTVLHGYLSNALVWVDTDSNGQRDWTDTNSNGKWDPGEGESWTLTDGSGQFTGITGTGTIRITANPVDPSSTKDISTGKPFTGNYSAPSGSTVVNPLTTLVVAAGGNAAAVKTALGLDPALDLNTYDPLAEAAKTGASSTALAIAIKAQSAATQIDNIMGIAASVATGAGATSTDSVAATVATTLMAAAGAGTVDLASSAVIASTITAAATNAGGNTAALTAVIDAVATSSAAVNNNIQTVSDHAATLAAQPGGTVNAVDALKQVVAAQIVSQETVAVQAKTAVTTNSSSGITVTAATIDNDVTAQIVNVQTIFANHAPTGDVTMSGVPKQNQTLTAHHTLADADGLGAISYHWQSDGVSIAGATGDTFVLGGTQVGHRISLMASYTDGAGHNESMTSIDAFVAADPYAAQPGGGTSAGTVIVGLGAIGLLAWVVL